jgi:hypothetical protein
MPRHDPIPSDDLRRAVQAVQNHLWHRSKVYPAAVSAAVNRRTRERLPIERVEAILRDLGWERREQPGQPAAWHRPYNQTMQALLSQQAKEKAQ